MTTIQQGDIVNVYWEYIDCEWGLEVKYLPEAPGESWILARKDGTLVYVKSFGKMVQQPAPTPQEAK